jgi:hypothetical protein
LGRHDFCTKPNKPARDESHHLNRPEQMRFMWGANFLKVGRDGWRRGGPLEGSSDATESGRGGTLSARSDPKGYTHPKLVENALPD